MKVDRSQVIKSLPKKGFRKETKKSRTHKEHIYFYHELDGKETGAYTYISHSAQKKDISNDLLLSMRKQLRLDTNRQAADLLSCPMDGDEYCEIIRSKGIL